MDRARQRVGPALRTIAGPIALLASIVPIALVALPMAKDEHERFATRYLEREPLPAPDVPAPQTELSPFEGGVPVLVYHGIGEPGRFAVTRDQFTRQLAMLDAAGVETITVDEYVAFLSGEPVELPRRPLLLTFDDGKLSSFRGADAALERYGMNAVMYAIAGETEDGSEYYLSADELSEMSASGRWEVQPHAGDQHHEIAYDAAGHTGPAYAYRADAESGRESFAAYRERVLADVDGATDRLAAEVDGFGAETFSFPYGAYGQYGNNDPRIPGFLKHALGARFAALFAQPSRPRFTTADGAARVLDRFEVRRRTGVGELARWLRSEAGRLAESGSVSAGTPPRSPAARARG